MSALVPSHLKKYVVPQNYQKYSPEDQSVWRYIMKGISHNLSLYGHTGSLKNLEKTGIQANKIPKISNIDKKLQQFGWRAVCISGFIPPRAFMEFQRNKILPIASELRTIQHLFYTPAPDIVHEAVGHVPFLTHPVFSNFLEQYAKTVLKAIFSHEDMELYKAIRDLSDLKENSKSSPQQIKKQEQKLSYLKQNISHTSEASYLSRLIWWTSEYGLIGSLKNPKIYGAGLISSIGESLDIKKVKKIKLSANCLNYSFDITNFQPQLFVAKNFEHLLEVLKKVSTKLAFSRGGAYGLNQAIKSKTVNTVELDSGLQISGVLEKSLTTNNSPVFLKFTGPVQLAYKNKQIKNHGIKYHTEGYSSPLKLLSKNKKPVFLWSDRDLKNEAKNKLVELNFKGGIKLKGVLVKTLRQQNRLLVLTFKNCLIKDNKGGLLYHPSWGLFDLAVGGKVVSVFSGPGDLKTYQLKDDFKPSKVPKKTWTKKQKTTFSIYKNIAEIKSLPKLKKNTNSLPNNQIQKIINKVKKQSYNWLMILELLEAFKKRFNNNATKNNTGKKVGENLKQQILNLCTKAEKTKLQNKKVFKLGKKFYNISKKDF